MCFKNIKKCIPVLLSFCTVLDVTCCTAVPKAVLSKPEMFDFLDTLLRDRWSVRTDPGLQLLTFIVNNNGILTCLSFTVINILN